MAGDLDDVSKTVIYIPYNPIEEEGFPRTEQGFFNSIDEERDLPNGPELRFEAYQQAWGKCLNRIRDIARELQEPSVQTLVKGINSSSLNALPGLPYPELQVVSVINPTFGSSFLNDVTMRLQADLEDTGLHSNTTCHIAHFHPADFPNVLTGMRSIISAFVEKEGTLESVKRKPTAALAAYDIQYLIAWHKALVESQAPLRHDLVIILHEFERFDSEVMEDVFYLFTTHSAYLPLVFLLSLSTPSPDYLHVVYPRSTLALLRVQNIVVPSGQKILQQILLKTFLDVEFDPDVILGPVALEFLIDHFTRYNASIDTILNIIQLAYLKHFSGEFLTALVQSTPTRAFERLESSKFVDGILARLAPSEPELAEFPNPNNWRSQTPSSVVTSVNEAREDFRLRSRNLRMGFGIIYRIQEFLEGCKYKGLGWSADPLVNGFCDAMVDVYRDSLKDEVRELRRIIRKLSLQELTSMMDVLHAYFYNMPSRVRTAEQDTRTKIVMFRSGLQNEVDGSTDTDSRVKKAREIGDWLAEYLSEKLAPLEEVDLWDVWYTGLTPFPADLLNPSVRASILSGLLRPYDYSEPSPLANTKSVNCGKSISELPDISILFKRYLDSGKMINVYDWFESFKGVLDAQRRELSKLRQGKKHLRTCASPIKKGTGRAKEKGKERELPSEERLEDGDGGGDEEKWKIEVQARFIQALHELDHLGFIKHTGRKADHVLRTVFDVDDAE